MQGNDDAVVSLVVDARGLQQGSIEAVALGKRIIDSFRAIEAAAKSVDAGIATSGTGIVKSLGDTNRFLGQIERSLNPLAAAANKAQAEMMRLVGIMGGSNVEASQRARVALEAQAQKVLSLKNVVALASEENKRLEATYAGLERAFQNAIGSLGSLIAKYQPASASAKQMTSELASLNSAYAAGLVTEQNYVAMNSRIVNSYNEGAVAAQRLLETRAKMIAQARQDQNTINSQTSFNQVLGVNPGSNAGSAVASASVFQRNFAQDEAELENINRTLAITNKAVKDAADRVDYLSNRFNQDATAAKNYRSTINDLNEAFAKNLIGHRELGLETSKAIDVYNRSTVVGEKASKSFAGGIREVGLNSRVAQYAMTNFSFQINDVVSGLAMGQQPFRIFAQQAGQFVQIFQQIGRENIGNFFKDMGREISSFGAAVGRWLITPVGAAVTILGTLALGLGAVIVNSFTAETRIRSFGVILRTMGTDSLSSANALDEVTRRLRDTGTAAKDAQSAVQGITRTPGINPTATGNIADLGRNISAARGISLETATSGLANALSGGADALTQYALNLGVKFNPVEQKAIELAILHRDKLEQLRIAYSAISRTMDGEFNKSLSEGARLTNNLFGAWHGLMDTLSNSSGMKHAIGVGTMFLDVLNKLISGQELYNKKAMEFDLGINKPSALENFRQMRKDSGLPVIGGSGVSVPGLQGLAPEFAEGLKGLIALAAEQGITIGITSGLRSTQRQSELFAADVIKGGGTPSGMVAKPGGSMHEFGFAADLNRDPRALEFAKQNASKFDLTFPMQGQRGMPNEPWHIELQGVRGGTNIPTSAGGTALAGQAADIELRSQALNKYALELVQAQAKISAVTEAEQKFKEATPENELQKQEFITNAVNEATRKFNDELNKGIIIENIKTKGTENAARAAESGISEMLKATAAAEANLRVKTEGISFEEAYRQALARGAAEAVKGAAEQVAAQIPVISGHQKLAEAAKISGQAEHDVRVANEANTITQRALDSAKAKGIDITGSLVDKLNQQARAQILATEAANNSLRVTREINAANDNIEISRLQVNLLGSTSEEISRQVALLQKKLELERDTTGLTQQQKEAILGATDAIQRQNVILAESNREWQRLESGIRSIADTIENTLTSRIKDAFDGNKVKSWGETIRTTLSSILSQIANFAFIKPAIGTALSAVGLTGLASQFGTFGSSLFGGSGSSGGLFGGSSSSGTQIVGTQNSDGTFSFKTLGDAAGVGKSIFDVFGSSGSSSGSGFFGNTFSGINDFLFGAGADFGGGGTGVFTTGIEGIGGTAGLFPGSSFGSLFGSIGAGFGAGTLLNSLVGGNPVGGTIGSGLGSIAGAAIGSLFGPIGGLIGSLLGGSGGGLLGGMFGNNKPSNFASGGLITLGAGGGVISGVNSEGNSDNDQISNQILEGVQGFTKELLAAVPGSSITGNLYTNIGKRDGIIVGGSIGGVSGQIEFQSAQEALEAAELLIVKSLDGVSEAFKIASQTLTDPSQIQDFIKFILIYDNLKDAFDSAFANIAADTKKIGPFETALNEITSIFDELTTKANEFGLSLEPINEGLGEATRRLRVDFVKTMTDAILGLQDPLKLIVQEEKKAGEDRLNDAIAIGASLVEVNKLNSLQLKAIWDNQTQSLEQLKDSLTSGTLSGLTISGQLTAANDNFERILGLVQGGNLGQIVNLAPAAQGAFSLSQQAFGNAPQTNVLRNQILEAIESVLTRRSFAEGTLSTPPGLILVGENGPEWMSQSGGNRIFPNNNLINSMNDNSELVSEIRSLRSDVNQLLGGGNSISREGFSQTINRLERMVRNLERPQKEEIPRRKLA